jgi:sialate O-acetylesterase
MKSFHPLVLLVFFLAAVSVRADVTLPAVFGDNMVLQRGAPVRVWGHADPGEQVTVRLAGEHATAATGADGQWTATLKPCAAGGPYTLTVTGHNTLTVRNVECGDVWLCGGQSNMEFSLKRALTGPQAIAASADPDLRLFKVGLARRDAPADDVKGAWKVAGPETTGGFSAVGYFFGRALRRAEHVPIGLISDNQGGTPAQAWTRAEVLATNPDLKTRYVDTDAPGQAQHDAAMAAYETARVQAKTEGKKEPQKPYGFWQSSKLYNGMIAPLTRFLIRGVIWFQGESNAKDPAGYRLLLPALIRDWRAQWGEPQMPFLIAQLAPFGSGAADATNWAEMREIQSNAAASLPAVGLAVTTDVGTQHNIHPTNKEPVGERLALQAREIAYGESDLVASGPTYHGMTREGSIITVTFDNVGDGLIARGGESSGVAVPADKLVGFTIAGTDGKFVLADARIVGKNTVEVSSPQVPAPQAVRYGFVNFPVVNLWNKNALPASPFRTDAP